MPGVIADQGVQDSLDELLASPPWSTAKLRLYQLGPTPPTDTAVLADFTEATFTGYAAVSLAWGSSSLAGHIATSQATQANFTITAGTQTIKGWYITNAAGTRLLASQMDPSQPINLAAASLNQYAVTVSISTKDTAT